MPTDISRIISCNSSHASVSNLADKLLIDIAELARITSLSIRTVRRMDAAHDVPGRVVVRRCVRFQTDVVREWIRAGLPGREQWTALQKRK